MKSFQGPAFLATALLQLATIHGSDAQLTHGASCGPPRTEFCNRESGLVCGPEFTCACSRGVVGTGLEYQLAWDAGQSKCLAQPDSPCFGTAAFPGPKSVTCTAGYRCTVQKDLALPPAFGLCKPAITALSHGAACNKDTFCNKAAGLICNAQFVCGCSRGSVTHELEYKLVWNAPAGKCVGEEGSACHTSAEVSQAQCGPELVCAQVEDQVPGIGACHLEVGAGSGAGTAALVGLNTIMLFVSAIILLQ